MAQLIEGFLSNDKPSVSANNKVKEEEKSLNSQIYQSKQEKADPYA